MEPCPPIALRNASGELLRHYGRRQVDFMSNGAPVRVVFQVVDVVRPTLSVARLKERGVKVELTTGKPTLRKADGKTLPLATRGGLFVLEVLPQKGRCAPMEGEVTAPLQAEEDTGDAAA